MKTTFRNVFVPCLAQPYHGSGIDHRLGNYYGGQAFFVEGIELGEAIQCKE